MISEHILESIQDSTDLAGLAREYGVKLTKSADGFTGLCPFHHEKTPSFRIHAKGPRAGQFKCFGCGEAGSAINFVMKIESWPFLTAVRSLAERCGISVEDRKVTTAQRAASAEDRLMAAWWWKQREMEMRAALDKAIEEHTQPDDDFCETTARLIRHVEEMSQETRFLMFKSQVTRQDREQWAADVEYDRVFGEAFVTLICGSRKEATEALRRINEQVTAQVTA